MNQEENHQVKILTEKLQEVGGAEWDSLIVPSVAPTNGGTIKLIFNIPTSNFLQGKYHRLAMVSNHGAFS
jgi:hypothetical protein